jgi:hypothetical protein
MKANIVGVQKIPQLTAQKYAKDLTAKNAPVF